MIAGVKETLDLKPFPVFYVVYSPVERSGIPIYRGAESLTASMSAAAIFVRLSARIWFTARKQKA